MRKAGFSCIFFVIILLAACSGRNEQTRDAPAKIEQPASELILQADEFYRQRADLGKLRQGVVLLQKARVADSQNFEAAWKLAKFNYFLGTRSNDREESEKALKAGVEAGKSAARIAPEKPDGYFWAGANLGARAQNNPLTVGIGSVDEIREMMNKVVEIQPEYQGASAYDALAQVELGSRLTGGSAQKALEFLEKAVAIEPNNAYVRLHLADALIRLNRRPEARKQIDYLLKMKPHPDFLPEYEDAAAQAKKLLETRF